MGWHSARCALDVRVLLDEHGGEREREHDKLWEEMMGRLQRAVRAIVVDPRYAELCPWADFDDAETCSPAEPTPGPLL